MKVAITGAAGYIGSLLVQAHAARGDTVHALTRNPASIASAAGVSVFAADLATPETIPAAFLERVDVLYHCAAELTREGLMQRVNVEGTQALLALARGRIRHWVQLSTVAVYGQPRSGVVWEHSSIRPDDTYARTKRDADALILANADDGFSHTILRPSTVIGPRMRNRSIYSLLDALERRLFFFIGRPGAILNYVHEENVISALLLCGERSEARYRVYNLSQDCSIELAISIVAAAIQRPSPRLRVPESFARIAARVGAAMPGFPLTSARIDALTSRVEYPVTRIGAELAYEHEKPLNAALHELAILWKRSRT